MISTGRLFYNTILIGLLTFVSIASFSAVEPNGESPIIYIPISAGDIFFVIPVASPSLPDDPEVSDGGLLGVDSDSDGVRDDIERFIAFSYPNDKETRMALYGMANSFQEILIERQNFSATVSNFNQMANSSKCLKDKRESFNDSSIISKKLMAKYLNTWERTTAYFQAESILHGKLINIPPVICISYQ